MYFDIDAILAEEQLLPCVFQTEAVGLGFLDASGVSDDLERSSRIDLPMWLAQDLMRRNVRPAPPCSARATVTVKL
jgi:GINS complex subunit 3